MSEIFLYFFPDNGDVNVSVMWLIIAVAFVLQVALNNFTAIQYNSGACQSNGVACSESR